MKTHQLDVYPEHYNDLMLGLRKVEIRLNDCNFQENDLLILNEIDSKTKKYTGNVLFRKVEYIIVDNALSKDYVAMQISKPL